MQHEDESQDRAVDGIAVGYCTVRVTIVKRILCFVYVITSLPGGGGNFSSTVSCCNGSSTSGCVAVGLSQRHSWHCVLSHILSSRIPPPFISQLTSLHVTCSSSSRERTAVNLSLISLQVCNYEGRQDAIDHSFCFNLPIVVVVEKCFRRCCCLRR